MSSCCQSNPLQEGTNRFFSRWSKSYARRFRKGKLDNVQKYLLEGVRKEPIHSKEILDIGCGVGSLHLTLLKEGAAKATGVDMAEGMISQAQKFSKQLGLSERTEYVVGDFVESAEKVGSADITLLDKVVCCYEDADTLVKESAEKTKRVYALSHPRQSFPVKAIFHTEIFFARLFRAKFHPFWHDWQRLRELITAQGFKLIYENATIVWQVAVYRRM